MTLGRPLPRAADGHHAAAGVAGLPAALRGRHGVLPRRRWSPTSPSRSRSTTLTGSNFAVGADRPGRARAAHRVRPVRRRAGRPRRPAQAADLDGRRPGGVHGVLAVNAFRDEPEPVGDLRASRACWPSSSVAAATLARGADAAHGPARPDHRRATRSPASACRSGVLVGPAIGGLLVAYVGIGWCFVVDIVGLLRRDGAVRRDAALPATSPRRPRPPGGHRRGHALRARAAATCSAPTSSTWPRCCWRCRWCCSRPWPTEVFDRPELLGLLYSAETVGALVATALSGWTARVHHHGRAIVVAAAAYGADDRAGRR